MTPLKLYSYNYFYSYRPWCELPFSLIVWEAFKALKVLTVFLKWGPWSKCHL